MPVARTSRYVTGAVLIGVAVALVTVEVGCGRTNLHERPVAAETRAREHLVGQMRSSLEGVTSIELLSLDPFPGPTKSQGTFHGWRVLGRTNVPVSHVQAVLASVSSDFQADPSIPACEIQPRHGLRLRGAHSVDLVICYWCRWADAYVGDSEVGAGSFRVRGATEESLNELLARAGIGLAPAAGA
jgi:hypothetical protein